MLLPSALLVVMCVLVGVFPGQTVEGFLKMATTALLGADAPHYDLALWHGLNLPVYMSLIALCGGVALYFSWLTRQRDAVPLLENIDGKRAFENCLRAMTSMASRILPVLSSDRLQTQLRFMMLVIVGGGILSLWNGGLTWGRITPVEESIRHTDYMRRVAGDLLKTPRGKNAFAASTSVTFLNNAQQALLAGGSDAPRIIAACRKQLSWGQIFATLRSRPLMGAAGALLKISPKLYRVLYGAYVRRNYGL